MVEAKNRDGLVGRIRTWAAELGFQALGVAEPAPGPAEARFEAWLAAGRHGDMAYMARHGRRRTRPAELVPGTRSVLSVRMDYLPEPHERMEAALMDPERAFVSRYALGRDYHKLMRKRLQRLAERIAGETGPFDYRVFVDSAPVLEKPLAALAGLGWVGKHTNILTRDAGSWFFLGEVYTDLELPPDGPEADHCGTCTRCMEVCPTGAITAPYELDARLCISYLTIEHFGPIPEPLRPLMGNRIYGCDDCQLYCPWNRFARTTQEQDFLPREGLDSASLVGLFAWDEATFLRRLEGSPIRRIGHERWLRNLAVALGNAPTSPEVAAALQSRAGHPSGLVREHVVWALGRHGIGGEAG